MSDRHPSPAEIRRAVAKARSMRRAFKGIAQPPIHRAILKAAKA